MNLVQIHSRALVEILALGVTWFGIFIVWIEFVPGQAEVVDDPINFGAAGPDPFDNIIGKGPRERCISA